MSTTMSDSDALFAEQPDWADVAPVAQHEPNANPIVPIFYTEACMLVCLRRPY